MLIAHIFEWGFFLLPVGTLAFIVCKSAQLAEKVIDWGYVDICSILEDKVWIDGGVKIS